MKQYQIMDGNEACATTSYYFTEVAGIYPITPSSPMAELTDEWSKQGKKNYFNDTVSVVEMQSEAGAAGMVHGSLQNGCLTTTYTASQGLLLMIPNMYKIAGELLPAVIHVAARSLSTHALSIFGDHQDIYATRQTGFAILASSSVQDAHDLAAVAHLSAIKGRVPFIHFFDGFRTSHELQKIELLDMDKVYPLLDQKALQKFRNRALNPNNPVTRGTAQNDDIYFQMTEARNKYYDNLEEIVASYMDDISRITKRTYKPFMYYGSKTAKRIIVAMGSVCETARETVEFLNRLGEEVGLIEVHLYRPFSKKYFLDVLPETVEQIAVLDRTKEAGSSGEPLYLDVVNVVKSTYPNIEIIGGRYGLSSKNTTPADIKAVFDFFDRKDHFTNFTVGIFDDVTNLSIDVSDFTLPSKNIEFLIYGYGSDGMVSACKDVMKITGTKTNAYVQGYFQYDSKKSGGVTKSHLRFSKEEIHAPYYVEKASILICTKDSYLKKYHLLDEIKEKGIFILNTEEDETTVWDLFRKEDIEFLKEKKIQFYIVNALSLAEELGLDHKISSIMECVLFKIGHLMDYHFATEEMKNHIKKKFANKSNDVVDKNIKAIDRALDTLKEVRLENIEIVRIGNVKKRDTLFDMIDERRGDLLKVSTFLENADGTFNPGLSKLEKRQISDIVPKYHPENCIMCNQCSFVCPHAVIRPFLLDEEEVKNAPLTVQEKLKDAKIKGHNYKFIISASIPDCTGCTLCENICPGLKGKKAITMEKVKNMSQEEKEEYEYLFHKVKEKKVLPTSTVKGSQFVTPKFEFPGACSGCGETSYLKLLTQLFPDSLVISNATGCSSIYSASAPSTVYSVPWASSLFEDNAEYGFGMKVADTKMKHRIKDIISTNIASIRDEEIDIYSEYLDHVTIDSSKKLYDIIDHTNIEELKPLKEFIQKKSIWITGGDGWAYDIGFSGIDHVLASKENINILVLDTEVYSNTGGQASKSSRVGAVSKFASHGKETAKKDLISFALGYPHVYVGAISLGANMQHTIKVLTEAEEYDGPSIVIAYAPCIAQGIVKGMKNTTEEQRLATESGYFPLLHYHPTEEKFYLDSKADFDKYYEFIAGEDRYRMLKKINPDKYRDLLEENKVNAMRRYQKYVDFSEKQATK